MGTGSLGIALKAKDVDDAPAYGLALEALFDGDGLRRRGRSAVQPLRRAAQLSRVYFHAASIAERFLAALRISALALIMSGRAIAT